MNKHVPSKNQQLLPTIVHGLSRQKREKVTLLRQIFTNPKISLINVCFAEALFVFVSSQMFLNCHANDYYGFFPGWTGRDRAACKNFIHEKKFFFLFQLLVVFSGIRTGCNKDFIVSWFLAPVSQQLIVGSFIKLIICACARAKEK